MPKIRWFSISCFLSIISCTPPLVTRAKNELPAVSCIFDSDDSIIDSIGKQDMKDFLLEGGQRLKITYHEGDASGKAYRILVSAKKLIPVDSLEQTKLFYEIYKIVRTNQQKNDSIAQSTWIPSEGTQVAMNVALNLLTVPFGGFSIISFEIPYSQLAEKDKAKIDSLTPRAKISYTTSLQHPEKGTTWSHDTTLAIKLPRFTTEYDQKIRCTSGLLNDVRRVVAKILK